nr:zinc knuckle CX2CX4HX4C [Tanacetum cinerariifolium]
MRQLKEDTFSGNKNEDAYDHVDQVLNIVSLFNILGVSQDAVLLRVLPFTLTETAKRWVDRLTLGAVNTWDLLKKAFIQRYCLPSKTAKRLEDIHNFKQESDESLYQAWEREEVKQVEEVNYGEFGRPSSFKGSNGTKFRVGPLRRLDFNNALADLGASISIMPFSMSKCLGIRKLEPVNMVIELADDTKCIPKGIVKNLLIKINKFILPIDFIILDIIEDFRMPVILGRPLLATANAKVDIFRKTISLEVGNEKRADEDDNDLEGIIDYLEPTLYDGFIDLDDEEYKERNIGLGEVYKKIKVSGVEDLSRTMGNIATIRAGIMDEIFRNHDKEESYDET